MYFRVLLLATFCVRKGGGAGEEDSSHSIPYYTHILFTVNTEHSTAPQTPSENPNQRPIQKLIESALKRVAEELLVGVTYDDETRTCSAWDGASSSKPRKEVY